MYKNFKQLLLNTSHLNMKHQEIELLAYFKQWKVLYEQVDDVTVLGIEL